jgi:hypothetical protein
LDGHFAPKFAYKRYITSKGGRYFDSERDKFETKQRTAYMFCPSCENVLIGSLDSWGAKFLARFVDDPYLPHGYDEQFLRWAVSLSLRALLSDASHNPERQPLPIDAMEQWKSYLLGTKTNIGGFAQHAFLRYYEGDSHFQRLLEWDYVPENNLTFFKIGPLVVFGVTRPVKWSRKEKLAAEASMVKAGGGYIQRVEEYVAGVNIPSLMKEVSNEKNIRLLEAVGASERRRQEFIEQVPEFTKLEMRARISEHRERHK